VYVHRIAIRQFSMTPRSGPTIPFLVMSWFAALVMPQISGAVGPLCFSLILGGGVAYSVGAVFYGSKRPEAHRGSLATMRALSRFTLMAPGLHFAASASPALTLEGGTTL